MVVYPLSYYSFYKIPPHIEIMVLKSVSRINSELSLNTHKSPSRIISFFIYFYSHFDVSFITVQEPATEVFAPLLTKVLTT